MTRHRKYGYGARLKLWRIRHLKRKASMRKVTEEEGGPELIVGAISPLAPWR